MQIYGIYLHWEKSSSTPYLLGVSCSKEILETMLISIIEEYKKKYEINDYIFKIESVKLYIASKEKDQDIKILLIEKFIRSFTNSVNTNIKILLREDFIKDKIYGMNKESLHSVEQVLLKVLHDSDENSIEYQSFLEELKNHILLKNNISSNSIEFDKYYDEGILNA